MPLEQPAGIALADELREVGAEEHVEDAVGLCLVERRDRGARLDLAEGRILLDDDLGAGHALLDETLEHLGGRLAVFVVRRDDRPALRAGGLGLLDQHADLHEVVGPDAEGVAVALRHGDGIGQGLGGDVDDLLLVGVIRHRDADIRQERAEEQRHALAGDELLGDPRGVARGRAVVAGDDLDLAARAPRPWR